LSAWTKLTDVLNDDETRRLLDTHQSRVVLVAVDGPNVRGIGEFAIHDTARQAEIALVVEDAFQHRGIGSRLYRALELLACQRGISAFTGDVHVANHRVLAMLQRIGRPLRTQLGFAGVRFVLSLAPSGDCPSLPHVTRLPYGDGHG
jgi:ribosomal protein S18 acetylase RimI-like enzyme